MPAKTPHSFVCEECATHPPPYERTCSALDYKGDVVQPYEIKNEWNRVVVFKINPNNDYRFLE